MIEPARDLDLSRPIEADICLVGGGPAGIAIALELARTRASVCLIESGEMAVEPRVQSLSEGESDGTLPGAGGPYLRETRLRALGGCTQVWSGWCRPLDPIDFEARPWVPDSGWPISRRDLDPYYERACALCAVPTFVGDPLRLSMMGRKPVDFGREWALETPIFERSGGERPLSFAAVCERELKSAKNVRVITGATVTELAADPSGRHVARAVASTLAGRKIEVKARIFALCAGALESARLLLTSRSVQKAGLGNENDLVGRYFMEHPHVPVGRIALYQPKAAWRLYSEWATEPGLKGHYRGAWQLSEEWQRNERLLNGNFVLLPLANWNELVATVAKAIVPGPPRKSPGAEASASDAASRTAAALSRLGAGVEGAPGPVQGVLLARTEQSPDRESRVKLAEGRDALGMHRLTLHWRLNDLDRRSLLTPALHFARALGATGLGRLQVWGDSPHWPYGAGGGHQLGVTRMHDDPKKGVVDRECRVHSLANLYVAGGGVFPTAGHADPALTIVALAIRLADRLRKEAGR